MQLSTRSHIRLEATENTAEGKGAVEEPLERVLAVDRTMLMMIDGAKTFRKAVTDLFGKKALCTVTVQLTRCTSTPMNRR